MVPFMELGWTVQWYLKLPAVANVREKVPLAWVGDFVPSSKVTLCPIAPLQVQVTVVPTATVVDEGVKKLSPMEMLLLVLPPVVPPGPVGGLEARVVRVGAPAIPVVGSGREGGFGGTLSHLRWLLRFRLSEGLARQVLRHRALLRRAEQIALVFHPARLQSQHDVLRRHHPQPRQRLRPSDPADVGFGPELTSAMTAATSGLEGG